MPTSLAFGGSLLLTTEGGAEVTVELDLVADEAFLRIMSEVAFVVLMLTNNYK